MILFSERGDIFMSGKPIRVSPYSHDPFAHLTMTDEELEELYSNRDSDFSAKTFAERFETEPSSEIQTIIDTVDKKVPEISKKAEEIIYRYVNTVDEREKEKVLHEIKDIEKKWQDKAETGSLWYRKKGKPSLLQPDTADDRFRIMNSMRSVEKESGVYLVGE